MIDTHNENLLCAIFYHENLYWFYYYDHLFYFSDIFYNTPVRYQILFGQCCWFISNFIAYLLALAHFRLKKKCIEFLWHSILEVWCIISFLQPMKLLQLFSRRKLVRYQYFIDTSNFYADWNSETFVFQFKYHRTLKTVCSSYIIYIHLHLNSLK